MSYFVCGTISHAKLLLHWSAIYYQMTFGGILGIVRRDLLCEAYRVFYLHEILIITVSCHHIFTGSLQV